MISLPSFRYHPDPLATGSFEARVITCAACGKSRNYVYVGPVYSEADLDKVICPWCISSGLAHERFSVEFTDIDAIGDYAPELSVPTEIKEEIAHRTPGFNGWQQERWLVHCNDGCMFLGPAGNEELAAYGSQALIESLRADLKLSDSEFRDYLEKLNKHTGPTAYVFQCLHCNQYQGYSDFY